MKKYYRHSITLLVLLTGCHFFSIRLQEYRSEPGRFSILLPGIPQISTESIHTPWGKSQIHRFTVNRREGAYWVIYNDYPESILFLQDLEPFFDEVQADAMANVQGTLLKQSPIHLDDHPGRHLRIKYTWKGKESVLLIRFVLAGPRLYQILVTTSPRRAEKAEIQKIFSSFRVWKASQANPMIQKNLQKEQKKP